MKNNKEEDVVHTEESGHKRYELTNHLGNVLAVINDRKIYNSTDQNYDPVLLSWSDYYAFGMTMPGRNGGVGYRYQFNGMETDNEISGSGNSYTTEFRQYDPRLGRWKSLDPLMAEYPGMSPYVAFNNNPIYFVDPFGLEGTNPDGGDKPAGLPESPEEGKTYTADNGQQYRYNEGGNWSLISKDAIGMPNYELKTEVVITLIPIYDEEPSAWSKFWSGVGDFIRGVSRDMRGNAKWSFGVELKSSDGERVGERSWLPSVEPENFKYVITIDNFDEVLEIAEVLGLASDVKDLANGVSNKPIPERKMAWNDYQKMTKGHFKGPGNRSSASNSWKNMNNAIEAMNKLMQMKYRANVLAAFRKFVGKRVMDAIGDELKPKIGVNDDGSIRTIIEQQDTIIIRKMPHPQSPSGQEYYLDTLKDTRK